MTGRAIEGGKGRFSFEAGSISLMLVNFVGDYWKDDVTAGRVHWKVVKLYIDGKLL